MRDTYVDFPALGPGTELSTPVHPAHLPLCPIQLSRAVGAHLLGYGMSSTNVKHKVILTSWSISKFSRRFFSPSNFFLCKFFHQNTLFEKSIHIDLPDPRCLKASNNIPVATFEQLGKTLLSDSVPEVRYTEILEQPHDHLWKRGKIFYCSPFHLFLSLPLSPHKKLYKKKKPKGRREITCSFPRFQQPRCDAHR